MKKSLSFILTFILMVTVLTACRNTAAEGSKESTDGADSSALVFEDRHTDDGRTVVGISMPDKLLERWNRDGMFLKSEFEDRGYEVILYFSDNLIDRQIQGIRKMVEEGADIIVVAAVDGAALVSVLNEAKAANVSIISYDRLLMDTDVVDYYVSFDNYMVGKMQAEYLIKALGLDDSLRTRTIEIVAGDPVDNNARYFYNGAIDTLQPYFDNHKLEILSGQSGFYETGTGQWSTEVAQQRVQIVLNSYYTNEPLDAILCSNDSTALGAANAVETDYAHDNNVIITGQDGDIANIYNIFDGKQAMTVYKVLKNEAVVTVDLASAILEGKSPDENLIYDSSWDFLCRYDTKSYNNGKKVVASYLLTPIVVDSSNIEQELFETGYYERTMSSIIVPGE